MIRRFLFSAALAVAFVAPAVAGGHATIRVSDLPKVLIARQPVAVEFTIHDAVGTPISKLHPVLIAERGKERMRITARPTGRAGRYAAPVAFPSGGAWTLTVDSGYCGNTHVMRDVQVAAVAK